MKPAVDVIKKENAFEFAAELPGLDARNIELSLQDDVLTIKGEKNEEKEEKTKDRYVSERRYGSFRRSLQLIELPPIAAKLVNSLGKPQAPRLTRIKASSRRPISLAATI